MNISKNLVSLDCALLHLKKEAEQKADNWRLQEIFNIRVTVNALIFEATLSEQVNYEIVREALECERRVKDLIENPEHAGNHEQFKEKE